MDADPPCGDGEWAWKSLLEVILFIIKGYNINKLICTLVLVIWDPKAYNKLKKKHIGGGSL